MSTSQQPSPELMNVSQMRRYLGCERDWLIEQAETKAIPAIPCGEGRFLFDPMLVNKALADRLIRESTGQG